MKRSIRWWGILALVALGLCVLPAVGRAAVLRQFPIPVASGASAAAEGIVTGSDGRLWFTESGTDRIGRLSTGGGFTDYPLTPGSHPLGIAAGPDGALWFTEAGGSRIGRITTAGGLAEFPVTPGSRPVGIATGADGALWFTEFAGDRIGRVTTAGTVTEYPLSPDAQPVAITAGPDGALWFTETGGSRIARIGRIDPATDKITEFPAYPAGSLGTATDPQGITVGPDGALWFTERAANKIGRLTVDGTLTEFDAAPGPFGITLGHDGALWFTQTGTGIPGAPSAPGLIGRLTTGGVLDLFPLKPRTGESPNDITVGPDGAIWITDGGTIARVSGDLTDTPPVISNLSMTHRSFRVPTRQRRAQTAFRFRLSANAGLRITIVRREHGKLRGPGDCRPARPHLANLPDCVARVVVAVVQRQRASAGPQSIGFTGYANGHRLRPGSYEANVLAFGGVRVSDLPKAHSIIFTILP